MTKRNDKHTREGRREDAVKRQVEHNKLTIEQKIVKASERRGQSRREIVRLGVQAGVYTGTAKLDGKLIGVNMKGD